MKWWAWGKKRFTEGNYVGEGAQRKRESWRVGTRSRGKQGPPGFRLAER